MAYTPSIDDIVALVYRGATASASWDPALAAMVELFGASTVCLGLSTRGARPFEVRTAAGPKIRLDVLMEWERTQRGAELSPTPQLGVPEFRFYAEDFPNDPVTKELLEFDVAFCMAYCFECIGGTDYVLNVARGIDDPPFGAIEIDAIKRIGNHFREAVRLRRDMVRSTLNSQFQAQVLDRLGIVGILIDPFGSVLSLNAGAERLLASKSCLKLQQHNRLVAINRTEDSELQQHVRNILAGTVPEGETFAMSLERADGGRPVGMIISSTRSISLATNRDENCVLLLLRDSETNIAIEGALVQKLFSFTRAEASLAIGLASGRRLEEIEQQMQIRHNTARAHLRSIFVKADVSRQAELVCLLANSVAPLAQRPRTPVAS